ncbi:hypothetical protein [Desulfuromusa kysingii]|nr:hypothetical protein [Desulfuromusa kysingii]
MQIAWARTVGNVQTGNIYSALLSEKASRQNRTTVRWSLALSILAVTFALFSLLFSALDWHGDKGWQEDQLAELKLQNSYLQMLSKNMNSTQP